MVVKTIIPAAVRTPVNVGTYVRTRPLNGSGWFEALRDDVMLHASNSIDLDLASLVMIMFQFHFHQNLGALYGVDLNPTEHVNSGSGTLTRSTHTMTHCHTCYYSLCAAESLKLTTTKGSHKVVQFVVPSQSQEC